MFNYFDIYFISVGILSKCLLFLFNGLIKNNFIMLKHALYETFNISKIISF